MTGGVQVAGEPTHHIGKPARLGQRRHLGREQADGELSRRAVAIMLSGSGQGYDLPMRRLLIGLTVTLLVVVSIGVGVAVARWPYAHLWR
jgi:hypothetical protein